MSLNYIQPLEPYCSYDPRIDFDTNDEDEVLGSDLGEKGYGDKILVYKGPKNNEYFEIQPISGTSGNASGSTDWSYFLPSRESVLDRTILLKADITVTLEAANNGTINAADVPLLKNRFALQAFPLHHCINTVQIQFDGNLYTVDLQNSFEYMKYYSYTEDEIKTWSSLAPTLLDNSFSYQAEVSNDVLTLRNQIGLSFVPSRGSFGFQKLNQTLGTAGTKAKTTLTYSVTECLVISPLIMNIIRQSGSTGVTGLSNLRIKITWKDTKKSFFDAFKMNVFTNAQSTFTGTGATGVIADPAYAVKNVQVPNLQTWTCNLSISNPKLILGVLTLPDTTIGPTITSYDYMRYQTQTETNQTISAGRGNQSFTSQNYNLSQIPHAVLLAMVPEKTGQNNTFNSLGGKIYSVADDGPGILINTIPDIFFPFTNVNIKLGNRSGILSNMPAETLYEINRQNGLSFCNYSNSGMGSTGSGNVDSGNWQITDMTNTNAYTCLPGQGCPLLLRFGKDISLDDASLAPGVACNTNFNIKYNVFNPYESGLTKAQLVVIFIYDGVFTISPSAGSSFNIGLLSREDVIASDKNRVDFGELQGAPGSGGMLGGVMVGGSFLSKLKKMGRASWNVIKNPKVQKYLRRGLNLAADLDIPGASAVNTAINTLESTLRDSRGDGMYRRGGMLGGNVLSATEIRRRLYQ